MFYIIIFERLVLSRNEVCSSSIHGVWMGGVLSIPSFTSKFVFKTTLLNLNIFRKKNLFFVKNFVTSWNFLNLSPPQNVSLTLNLYHQCFLTKFRVWAFPRKSSQNVHFIAQHYLLQLSNCGNIMTRNEI